MVDVLEVFSTREMMSAVPFLCSTFLALTTV
jgi:hypothetical protein